MLYTPNRLAFAPLAAALLALCALPAGAQQAMKIAVINTEDVLLQSATGKKALADLKTFQQQKEKQGQACRMRSRTCRPGSPTAACRCRRTS